MVVIRINGNIHPEQAKIIVEGIHAQAHAGVIVLPSICELLNEVPADEEIQVIHQDPRVAELEAELARAMFYISAQKECQTCKHEMNPYMSDDCLADCEKCTGAACQGICKTCINGSNWEWRGACGTN